MAWRGQQSDELWLSPEDNFAVADGCANGSECGDIGERIAIEQNQVRGRADLDATRIATEAHRRRGCQRSEDGHWAEARCQHRPVFRQRVVVRDETGIGPEKDRAAGRMENTQLGTSGADEALDHRLRQTVRPQLPVKQIQRRRKRYVPSDHTCDELIAPRASRRCRMGKNVDAIIDSERYTFRIGWMSDDKRATLASNSGHGGDDGRRHVRRLCRRLERPRKQFDAGDSAVEDAPSRRRRLGRVWQFGQTHTRQVGGRAIRANETAAGPNNARTAQAPGTDIGKQRCRRCRRRAHINNIDEPVLQPVPRQRSLPIRCPAGRIEMDVGIPETRNNNTLFRGQLVVGRIREVIANGRNAAVADSNVLRLARPCIRAGENARVAYDQIGRVWRDGAAARECTGRQQESAADAR